MKTGWFQWDERTEQVAGRSAMIVLGLTQTALGVMLLVRLYVFDQPDSELRDVQLVLLGSIVGYFVLRSFLGGIMLVPTLKQAIVAWLSLSGLLFVVLSLWFGLPELQDWSTTILPAVLGPALIVGGYWLIAYLGRRRLENSLKEP